MSSLGDARAKRPLETSAARQQRERTPSDTAPTAHPGTPLVVKGVRPAGRRTRGDRRANAKHERSPKWSRIQRYALVGVEETGNDPSAGSPTETLLRLLLPLNDKVWTASRGIAAGEPAASPQSGGLTGSFNR